MRVPSLLWLTSVLLLGAHGDEHTHNYKDGEEVVLWMNTVGPFHNRQETYRYFSLPFCKGKKASIGHYHETLGESLQGVELEFSGLDITFKGSFVLRLHTSPSMDVLYGNFVQTNVFLAKTEQTPSLLGLKPGRGGFGQQTQIGILTSVILTSNPDLISLYLDAR